MPATNTCELCAIRCSSTALLEQHLTGRRHAQALETAAQRSALAARSIFLASASGGALPVTHDELRRALADYGAVERILPERRVAYGDVAQNFAIVEFERADDAQKILRDLKRLKVGDHMLNVRERKMDFETTAAVKTTEADELGAEAVARLLRDLSNDDADENAQIDALIARFALDDEAIAERVQFVANFRDFLQNFFAEPIDVNVFGSTRTGLGFCDADLDLDLVFCNCCNGVAAENGKSDDPILVADLDLNQLELNRLHRRQFFLLTSHERIQLLTRLINRFRRERAHITSIVGARDARYPIVRFDMRCDSKPKASNTLHCELSIENTFSERKADFVGELAAMDVTIRRLLFVVKLWAQCHGLFVGRGALNSYTLSLLVISFLQTRGHISALRVRPDSARLRGWPIDFDVDVTPRPLDVPISTLLKDLFIFLYNKVGQSNVHCIQSAGVVPLARFDSSVFKPFQANNCTTNADEKREKRDDANVKSADARNRNARFRCALVNVQDPMELTHNVAAGVTRSTLTRFRRALMFSIVALKEHQQQSHRTRVDLAAIFRLNELEVRFAASADEKARENAQHRKSANILTISLGEERPHAGVVFDAFVALLQDVLLLEVGDEPPAKRTRQPDAATNGGRRSGSIESDQMVSGGRAVEFVARYVTWMRRRQERRKFIANDKLAANLPTLLLEREVSKRLRDAQPIQSTSLRKEPELFRFGVQLYLSETESDLPSDLKVSINNDDHHHHHNDEADSPDGPSPDDDDDEHSRGVAEPPLLRTTASDHAASGAELYVIFRPPSTSNSAAGVSGAVSGGNFRDLVHFLSTFLVAHLPDRVVEMNTRARAFFISQPPVRGKSVTPPELECMDTS